MRATLYLDQNILGHIDSPQVSDLFVSLRKQERFPVISHNHLTEIGLSDDPEKFINRLKVLRPLFFSKEKSESIHREGNVELLEIDAEREIYWHLDNLREIEQKFFQAFFPMLKMSGGLGQVELEEIVDDYVFSMRSSVTSLTGDMGWISKCLFGLPIRWKLRRAERQIRSNFKTADFETAARKVSDIRRRIASLGRISQIPANQVAHSIIAQLSEDERRDFIAMYPPGFAVGLLDRSQKLMNFALILFSYGAISGSGRVFGGKSVTQKSRYRAQILDCLHIGEASFFDAFITCDAGAHRLAQVVYSYAGLPTNVVKMEISGAG